MPNYTKPEGWVDSPFWETYAANFANDGSEDQLAAALSHAVPEEWLKGYKTPWDFESDTFRRDAGYGSGTAFEDARRKGKNPNDAAATVKRIEDPNAIMSSYSQALQKRLKDDFSKNQGSYLDRGKASLRDQSQQALESDFGTIDENANARGLLYSGKRQSAKAAAAAQKASDLGAATTQFEQGLADTGRAVNNADYASDINSLLQQQDLNSIASGAFYNKLQNDLVGTEGMVQGLGSLGQGGGSFLGSMTAKKKAS
jgi:hypothetical protein